MFGICIWAELSQTNILYHINKLLVIKCKSQLHSPHITLEYNSKETNIDKFEKCDFKKKGDVYHSVTKNFYSLQQDYINENNEIYHISLAYKVNNPFTKCDINYANNLDIPLKITKEQFDITIWNCDSVYTKDWFKIGLRLV
jgi:hypothetical protein